MNTWFLQFNTISCSLSVVQKLLITMINIMSPIFYLLGFLRGLRNIWISTTTKLMSRVSRKQVMPTFIIKSNFKCLLYSTGNGKITTDKLQWNAIINFNYLTLSSIQSFTGMRQAEKPTFQCRFWNCGLWIMAKENFIMCWPSFVLSGITFDFLFLSFVFFKGLNFVLHFTG